MNRNRQSDSPPPNDDSVSQLMDELNAIIQKTDRLSAPFCEIGRRLVEHPDLQSWLSREVHSFRIKYGTKLSFQELASAFHLAFWVDLPGIVLRIQRTSGKLSENRVWAYFAAIARYSMLKEHWKALRGFREVPFPENFEPDAREETDFEDLLNKFDPLSDVIAAQVSGAPRDPLTIRILFRDSLGMSGQEIARQLEISRAMVSRHLKNKDRRQ